MNIKRLKLIMGLKIMYEIEKGIPAPLPAFRRTRDIFDATEVGDSFVTPDADTNLIRIAIDRYTKRSTGVKFATRKDKATKTIRVWRIA